MFAERMPRITKAGKDDRGIIVLSICKTDLFVNDENCLLHILLNDADNSAPM